MNRNIFVIAIQRNYQFNCVLLSARGENALR